MASQEDRPNTVAGRFAEELRTGEKLRIMDGPNDLALSTSLFFKPLNNNFMGRVPVSFSVFIDTQVGPQPFVVVVTGVNESWFPGTSKDCYLIQAQAEGCPPFQFFYDSRKRQGEVSKALVHRYRAAVERRRQQEDKK